MKNTLILIAIMVAIGSINLTAQTELNAKINNSRQAALIVAELMKNENAKKVIIAGIRSGYYFDESILFRDLLNPGTSPAFRNNAYLGSVPANSFAIAFRNAVSSGQYPQSTQYPTGNDLENFLVANNAQIYFPYSDYFNLNNSINPVITYFPGENETSSAGWLLDHGNHTNIIITEEYAMANPTFIVNFFDGNPDKITENPTMGPPASPSPASEGACEQPPHRMAVKVAEIYYATHWDNMWNGGGPEFYFCRGELTYSGDGNQIGAVPNSALVQLKRKDRGKWCQAQVDWDTRWEFINDEFEENGQQFALYEDDSASNTVISLTGSVTGEVKIPKIGGVQYAVSPSVTHTITQDDEVIINTQWDRCWFLSTNNSNQGLGVRNGIAIRGVGGAKAVLFTMKVTPY